MKEGIIVVTLFLVLIFAGFEIEKYKYQDCRKVRYNRLYCMLNIGK